MPEEFEPQWLKDFNKRRENWATPQMPAEAKGVSDSTPSGDLKNESESAPEEIVPQFRKRIEAEFVRMQEQQRATNFIKEARESIIDFAKMPWWNPKVALGLICGAVMLGIFLASSIVVGLLIWIINLILTASASEIQLAFWIPTLATAGVIALAGTAAFVMLRIDSLFEQVPLEEVGLYLKWGEQPICHKVDPKGCFKVLSAGLYPAPKPFFAIKKYPVANKVVDFKPHTMTVQDPQMLVVKEAAKRVAGNDDERAKIEKELEEMLSNIVFKGKMTIRPDFEDARSLILLFQRNGGLDKVGGRLEEAITRKFQQYLSSTVGPDNQFQALALDDLANKVIILKAEEDVAKSGVVIETISPDLKLPEKMIQAIEDANVEDAEFRKETKNARALLYAMAMFGLGKTKVTDEDINEFFSKSENRLKGNVAALLAGRANKTLGEESPFRITEIIGDKDSLVGLITKIAEGTKIKE